MDSRELGEHRLTSGESTGVVPHSQRTLTTMVDPSHFLRSSLRGSRLNDRFGGLGKVDGSICAQNVDFYSFCQAAGPLHGAVLQLPHQKQAESGLMVSLVLWDISFRE